MAAPIALREDFDALALRGLAKKTRDANQSRRLLALAAIYDGGSRGQAARIGGVGLQTMRDWVLRFNARGPDGLIDGKAPDGRPAQRRPAPGTRPHHRERPDPGDPWGGALAADQLGAVGVGGVSHQGCQADFEPAVAGDGLPQALGPASASRPQRARRRGF